MPDNENQRPPVELDQHRGMAAQVATNVRRRSSEVVADQEALRQGQAELERALFAVPATSWPEAAARANYLLRRFAATPEAQDPRIKQLIADVLDDFKRLEGKANLGSS